MVILAGTGCWLKLGSSQLWAHQKMSVQTGIQGGLLPSPPSSLLYTPKHKRRFNIGTWHTPAPTLSPSNPDCDWAINTSKRDIGCLSQRERGRLPTKHHPNPLPLRLWDATNNAGKARTFCSACMNPTSKGV